MSRKRLMAGVMLALLSLSVPSAALGQDGAETPEGTTWDLASYASDGTLVEVPEAVEATLLLQDGVVEGSAGCNSFFGAYQVDGSTISFQDLGRTLMACEGEAQVVEDAYMAALETVASWSIVDGRLHLEDADGNPILILDIAADVTSPADLATILSLLTELQGQLGELEARIAELEGAGSAGDGGSSDGNGGGGGNAASAPRAPAPRGQVQTEFPEYLRDPFTPPQEVEDPNQEVVRWRDRSANEAGFVIYARRGWCVLRQGVDPEQNLDESDFRLTRGPTVRIARVPADRERYRPAHLEIDAALPEKPISPYSNDEFYDLYVAAVNGAGQSERVKVASFFLTPEFNCP